MTDLHCTEEIDRKLTFAPTITELPKGSIMARSSSSSRSILAFNAAYEARTGLKRCPRIRATTMDRHLKSRRQVQSFGSRSPATFALASYFTLVTQTQTHMTDQVSSSSLGKHARSQRVRQDQEPGEVGESSSGSQTTSQDSRS